MGYDAPCSLSFEGRIERGTAWLEHKDLVFRGPHRLAIPLKDVTEARAEAGTLYVRFGVKRAAFEIGDAAEKWARRITNPPSRLDKLGVKPGTRVALLGVKDEDFERELQERGAELTRRAPTGGSRVDLLFLAANASDDLSRLQTLKAAIHPAGAIWVVRPKGRPEITEAATMAAGKKAGLVDVKVVGFSDSHTAEKFVVPRDARERGTASQELMPAAIRSRSRRSSTPSPRKS